MDGGEHYDEQARERLVREPPKRVEAPERTPFERDRARVVHAASFRRLAAKTQVMGPGFDDFVRNRLTHSLEVAQIARDLARALGGASGGQPDIAETAALAHDLGHPPFGHNGEQALDDLGGACGGFEGNAQTLRLLTRLEAKSVDDKGASVGLNLTRATLDACTKYPWTRSGPGTKFGVYEDDRRIFEWLRAGAPDTRQCIEAQVMDLADDVAYSVHDVEDGVVAGRIDLTRLDLAAIGDTVRDWYLPEATDDILAEALEDLRRQDSWPRATYDGTRTGLGALKNLTSDLIGRFCGAVQHATYAASGGPFVRYEADLVVPSATRVEIALLKGIAAHYVMRAQDRLDLMRRQRELLGELVTVVSDRADAVLETPFAEDWRAAADDAARLRVVLDQVASLTDASAVAWHARLCR